MQPLSRKRHCSLIILWSIGIFILCSLPGDDIPDPGLKIPHLDKIVHGGMFFASTLLLVFPLRHFRHFTRRQAYLTALLYALIYGGVLEILQHYFFNRSGDLQDLAADACGALLGCLCYPFIIRFLRLKE